MRRSFRAWPWLALVACHASGDATSDATTGEPTSMSLATSDVATSAVDSSEDGLDVDRRDVIR